MPPSGGAAREEELLTDAGRSCARSFNTFLESLTAYTDLDKISLSCYDSEALQERLHALRMRGQHGASARIEGEVSPHEAEYD